MQLLNLLFSVDSYLRKHLSKLSVLFVSVLQLKQKQNSEVLPVLGEGVAQLSAFNSIPIPVKCHEYNIIQIQCSPPL